MVAQDASPTPNAGADIFDPAVAEATPIPGVETFEVESGDAHHGPRRLPARSSGRRTARPILAEVRGLRRSGAARERRSFAWSTGRSGSPINRICQRAIGRPWRQLAEGQQYVLISPYPGLEDPIVASAWGAQLRLDDVNDPRLQAFIARYAGNGPERGATCDTGVETTVAG